MIDVVLVEDNDELADLMKALLLKKGFSLCCIKSGEEFLEWFSNHTAKILLLDIMLPGIDGYAICQAVRKETNIPILILSAKSDKMDQLLGFELGADDYMEKPVDFDILSAKIKALLTRFTKIDESKIISGSITIDVDSHQVYVKGKLVDLNVKEFELLLLFVKNNRKTLHKNYLFQQVWGIDSFSEEQTLTVHIKMLRSKIEDNSRKPKRIVTVWGVGYRYEEV